MKKQTLQLFLFAVLFAFSCNAYAARAEQLFSIQYDQPEPGKYRSNIVRIIWDTAPVPGMPGYDDSFPVQNSEGRNVSFMEHIHFAVTDTQIDPRSNDYADILYTHYDLDEGQVAAMNWALDQTWANSGCYPIPTRIADASVAYNCFAYALGYSDIAVNDIKYFSKSIYFSSGVPDWRPLQSQEKPDRAAHGYKNEEHGSIVAQETRTFTLGLYFTFSVDIDVYIGKYGEWGVYKSDGAQAPEYFTLPDTKNLKQR